MYMFCDTSFWLVFVSRNQRKARDFGPVLTQTQIVDPVPSRPAPGLSLVRGGIPLNPRVKLLAGDQFRPPSL